MSYDEEIRHFRMINSEEVIAEIIGETETSYILKNPYMVIEVSETMTLAKYVPFSANQSVEIQKKHIITKTELHAEMIRYYKNTMTIGKNTAEAAMVGLAGINDAMEEYIYEGKVPASMAHNLDLSTSLTHPGSNTFH